MGLGKQSMKPATFRLRSLPKRLRPAGLTLVIIILCAAVAYLAPLAATAVIGQEILHDQAQSLLGQALGRPVAIEGPVRLTMLPWLGLRAEAVSVANGQEFGPQPLLKVESATVGLSLSALLRRRIALDSLALRLPVLHLSRDAQGRENWHFGPQDEADGTPWRLETLPSRLRLDGATVSFVDQGTGQGFTVRRLNLITGPSEPFDFSLSCEVVDGPASRTGAEIHAKGLASYGQTGEYLFIHRAEVAGRAWLPAPGQEEGQEGTFQAFFSGNLLFHGQAGAMELSQLVVQGLGLKATGQLDAAGLYAKEPTFLAHLSISADRRGQWARLLGLDGIKAAEGRRKASQEQGESFRAAQPQSDIEAQVVAGASPEGWVVDKLALRDGQGRLDASASRVGDDLSFKISANALDLDDWIPSGEATWWALPDMAQSRLKVGGSLEAKDVRLAGLDILEAQLTARGGQGGLRLYPVTARTEQALLAADLNLQPAPGGQTLGLKAQLTPLLANPDNRSLGDRTGEFNFNGEFGPTSLNGKASLRLGQAMDQWTPKNWPAGWENQWKALAGLSAKCSFRVGRDSGWEVADLDVSTPRTRASGRISGKDGKCSLDLALDRLDLDALAGLAGSGRGFSDIAPWPLDGRVTVKHLGLWGLDIDDVLATGQADNSSVKLSSLNAGLSGGRLSGALDMEVQGDGRSLSANLAVSDLPSNRLEPWLPAGLKLSGNLDGKLSLEAADRPGQAWWRNLKAQADLQMGIGTVQWPGDQGQKARPGSAWPVNRAGLSLKAQTHPPASTGTDQPREAALAEVTGQVNLDMPGLVRQSRVDVHGQAGLDQAGKPLWYRQPKAEGSLSAAIPFAPAGHLLPCTWQGKFEADLDKGSFALSDLDFRAAGVPGKARLNGVPGPSGLVLTGGLAIGEFNPRDAAARLGLAIPALAEAQAWRRARLTAEIGGTVRELRLQHIQAGLDDTEATGQVQLSGPKTLIDLTVNSLDMDRLAPNPPAPDPAKRVEEPLPLETLRDLDLEVKARLGRLVRNKLVWERVEMDFTDSLGRFSLRQRSEGFYGGNFALDVHGDARGRELEAQMDLRAMGFAAPWLLWDLAGGSTLTKGKADFQVSLNTRGATDLGLLRNASGSARLLVSDGQLDLKAKGARSTKAGPQAPPGDKGDTAQPAPAASAPAASSSGLAFNRLSADFQVREGVGNTKDFALIGPDVNTKGEGWVNLNNERIDLSLVASVKDVGDVPVRIQGPLYDPGLEIDRSKVLGDTVKNLVKGVMSIPGSVVNWLGGLF